MGFFKKIGKFFKKAAKKVGGAAKALGGVALSVIPGGGIVKGAMGALGGILGGNASPATGPVAGTPGILPQGGVAPGVHAQGLIPNQQAGFGQWGQKKGFFSQIQDWAGRNKLAAGAIVAFGGSALGWWKLPFGRRR